MKCPECRNILRPIECKSVTIHECVKCNGKWFQRDELQKVKTGYEAAVKYRDIADERNVIKKENFNLKEDKEGNVLGTFLSEDCPYRDCCIERKKARTWI